MNYLKKRKKERKKERKSFRGGVKSILSIIFIVVSAQWQSLVHLEV
jgi:hypothetical protein